MYSLERLSEITPQKRAQLISFGLGDVESLATAFPRTYYDFRAVTPIKDLSYGKMAAVSGRVVRMLTNSAANTLVIRDADGNQMHITWFNTDYLFLQFKVGDIGYFCGRVTDYNMTWTITNPIDASTDPSRILKLRPVYTKHKGLSEQYLKNSISLAVNFLETNRKDFARDNLARQMGLPDYVKAVRTLHAPDTPGACRAAMKRMAFEDIYDFYTELKRKEQFRTAASIGPIKKLDATADLVKNRFPFALTDGQLAALRAIATKCVKGQRLHSVISGDVGCGKTAVALIAAFMMAENGFQTVVAAPTLVLAKQHFESMPKLCAASGVNGHPLRFALLTGETKARERKIILSGLESGEIDVLVGTHAVFSPEIKFHSLGMTIIDEEHKFGVEQKASLEELDREGAHHLSMTATPIPRSIAMTVYTSESDVIPIETMPAGRKAVITRQCSTADEAFGKILEEIRAGHQAYVVCPFIEDSASEKFQGVASVVSAENAFRAWLAKTPGVRVRFSSISGDMRQSDVLHTIGEFASGQLDVLFSTTIVEVGVNVPNATVICVLSAERFGLAALHQLRGRVGRGGDQGYCLLVSGEKSDKLDVLCSTTNGFRIAEEDLRLRGPGDLVGLSQTGSNKVIDRILAYPVLAREIKAHFFPGA